MNTKRQCRNPRTVSNRRLNAHAKYVRAHVARAGLEPATPHKILASVTTAPVAGRSFSTIAKIVVFVCITHQMHPEMSTNSVWMWMILLWGSLPANSILDTSFGSRNMFSNVLVLYFEIIFFRLPGIQMKNYKHTPKSQAHARLRYTTISQNYTVTS